MNDKVEIFLSGVAGGVVAAGYIAWGGAARFAFDVVVAGLAAYYLAPLVVQFTPATVEIATSVGFIVGLVSGIIIDKVLTKLVKYDFGLMERVMGDKKRKAESDRYSGDKTAVDAMSVVIKNKVKKDSK